MGTAMSVQRMLKAASAFIARLWGDYIDGDKFDPEAFLVENDKSLNSE
jgi:hypothetical protein